MRNGCSVHGLANGLVEQDRPANVLAQSFCCEQRAAIQEAIFLIVWYVVGCLDYFRICGIIGRISRFTSAENENQIAVADSQLGVCPVILEEASFGKTGLIESRFDELWILYVHE